MINLEGDNSLLFVEAKHCILANYSVYFEGSQCQQFVISLYEKKETDIVTSLYEKKKQSLSSLVDKTGSFWCIDGLYQINKRNRTKRNRTCN